MSSLAEEYVIQQERLRQCLINGKEIGPTGFFYCHVIEDLLKRADKAAMEQDITKMILIYQEMKEIKE